MPNLTMTTQFLAAALALEPPPGAKPLDPPVPCAICGATITSGAPVKNLIKTTTAGIADVFRYAAAYTCHSCAACFSDARFTGSHFVSGTAALKPVVALTSATDERPAWRDLVRVIQRGTVNVSIITSNTKRRLWPLAVISTFSDSWQPLFVDGDTERLLNIHVNKLRVCLELVERVYAFGFTKRAIATSLMSGINVKSLAASLADVMRFESQLAAWRGTDEFTLALFIAQKVNQNDH